MLDFHVYNKPINKKALHKSTQNFRIANDFLEILKILRAFMFTCSGKIREISENECSGK